MRDCRGGIVTSGAGECGTCAGGWIFPLGGGGLGGGHLYAMVTYWTVVLLIIVSGQNTVAPDGGRGRPHCYDWQLQKIEQGDEYVPDRHDPCRQCTCNDGGPAMCISVRCSPPNCPFYEQIEGECCKFHCPKVGDHPKGKLNNSTVLAPPRNKPPVIGNDETTNLGLRLVASTVTSFLILALLLFMIHRLRRRRMLLMMQRMYDGGLPRHRRHRGSDVVAAAYISEYDDMEVGPYEEPPPPYSPPRPPRFMSRDQPPPYEALPPTGAQDVTAGTLSLRGAAQPVSQRISNASIALVNGTLTFRVSNPIDDAQQDQRADDSAARPTSRTEQSSHSTNVNNTEPVEEVREREYFSPETVVESERLRQCHYENVTPRHQQQQQQQDVVDLSTTTRDGATEAEPVRTSLSENDDEPMAVSTERFISQFSCTDSDDSDTFRRDSCQTLPRRLRQPLVPRSMTSVELGRHDRRRNPLFIRRSDDIEIRRLRDSPRTSFYLDDISDSDDTVTPECRQDFTRRPCYIGQSSIVLEESDNRKVVWSSPEHSNQIPSGPAERFRIGKFGSPDNRQNLNSPGRFRLSLPPMSLHLDEDEISPSSPDIYPGAKQFQSPITPTWDKDYTTKLSISPGTPLQPIKPVRMTTLVRSNSLGSQISCLSVCSETGEKRKRKGRSESPSGISRKFPSMSTLREPIVTEADSNTSICSCPGDYSCPGDLDSETVSTNHVASCFGGARPKTGRRKSRKLKTKKNKTVPLNRNLTSKKVDNDHVRKQTNVDNNGNFTTVDEGPVSLTQYGFIDIPLSLSPVKLPAGNQAGWWQHRRCVDDNALDKIKSRSPSGKKRKNWRKKRKTASFDRPDFPSPLSSPQRRPEDTTVVNLFETTI